MAFSTEVLNVTNNRVAPKVVDNVLNGNLFGIRMLQNARRFKDAKHPKLLKYQKSTQGGSYSGMGNFAMSVEQNTVKLEKEPTSFAQPVTVDNLSRAVNAGDAQIINFLKYRMESAEEDMVDSLGDIFYGSGSGDDADGLGNIVDDGSVAGTYRGQSRTTYAGLNADVTTSVGTILLDDMAAVVDATTIGQFEPTLIITTKSVYSYLEKLLFPAAQMTSNANNYGYVTRRGFTKGSQGIGGELGFRAIFYRGIPIVADDKCTAGYLYVLNEKFLYWAGLKHPVHGSIAFTASTVEEMEKLPSKNHGICWTGLKEPVNSDGETGQFLLYGDMVCDSPRHQGVLQGIDG